MKKVTTFTILLLVSCIFYNIFDIYIVESYSMEPTLLTGDIVICSAFISIERSDILIFRDETNKINSIKRVIGIPGDHILYADKRLQINGNLIKKEFVKKAGIHSIADLMFTQVINDKAFTIYENYGNIDRGILANDIEGYFLLGDNRDKSVDSRFLGFIGKKHIKCKVLGILASEHNEQVTFHRMRLL